MLYAQTDPDPGPSNYKYPSSVPNLLVFLYARFIMSATIHPVACDRSCQDFVNHARHECCLVCHPPLPSSAQRTHCPECHLPADLSEEVAKLTAAVVELQDLVVDLHERLVGDELDDEE